MARMRSSASAHRWHGTHSRIRCSRCHPTAARVPWVVPAGCRRVLGPASGMPGSGAYGSVRPRAASAIMAPSWSGAVLRMVRVAWCSVSSSKAGAGRASAAAMRCSMSVLSLLTGSRLPCRADLVDQRREIGERPVDNLVAGACELHERHGPLAGRGVEPTVEGPGVAVLVGPLAGRVVLVGVVVEAERGPVSREGARERGELRGGLAEELAAAGALAHARVAKEGGEPLDLVEGGRA